MLVAVLVGCSDRTDQGSSSPPGAPTIEAGAASRSVLPTVDGGRAYLEEAPGWPADAADLDPDDPGTFVAAWDQGTVDVGNGSGDSAWVHDDLRATVVALARGDQRALLVSTDTYMHFGPDVDAITERVHDAVPDAWSDAAVLVAATHNHHGPDTAFSVNRDWYEVLADQVAAAAAEAVSELRPAAVAVASGEHGYGVADVRDPIILDRRLNVLAIDAVDDRTPIATIVQWASHPETTLGWDPPLTADEAAEVCSTKGWAGDDCTAEGRYLTADHPGVLRAQLRRERGGEVLYLNGALGNQIGPGRAATWVVDDDHPVTPDGVAPPGADQLVPCPDGGPDLTCQNLAKTYSIGSQLADAVLALVGDADPVTISEVTVRTQPFLTRLTNIGFRVLIAEGSIGWQDATLYSCPDLADGERPSFETCAVAPEETVEDPVVTPLADSRIAAGDVVASRVARVDLGPVGMLWLPGEIPPEMVVGLPPDLATDTPRYFRTPELHATGDAYTVPGRLLDLPEEDVTFVVGLGGDQLGYAVPVADQRLRCIDLALPGGASCADLAARDVLPDPGWVDGETCQRVTESRAARDALGTDADAVVAACRYGQALGRELGEPPGHYEETNSAGWDVAEDIWTAAVALYR